MIVSIDKAKYFVDREILLCFYDSHPVGTKSWRRGFVFVFAADREDQKKARKNKKR